MKICFISDTHNQHKSVKIEKCDIIIHAGDFCNFGKDYEAEEFFNWFSSLNQCQHKVFIPGNHDRVLELAPKYIASIIPNNIVYLNNKGITINGLKLYGTPAQPEFYNWSFNYPETFLYNFWNLIPANIDILITHCPPYGIRDPNFKKESVGSPSLLNCVKNRIKPKYHVFGHLHQGYGMEQQDDIIFINAALTNDNYKLINPPIYIDILKKSEA